MLSLVFSSLVTLNLEVKSLERSHTIPPVLVHTLLLKFTLKRRISLQTESESTRNLNVESETRTLERRARDVFIEVAFSLSLSHFLLPFCKRLAPIRTPSILDSTTFCLQGSAWLLPLPRSTFNIFH